MENEMISMAYHYMQSMTRALGDSSLRLSNPDLFMRLSEGLGRICNWIRRFEAASAADQASVAMWNDWYENVAQVSDAFTDWLIGPPPEVKPLNLSIEFLEALERIVEDGRRERVP